MDGTRFCLLCLFVIMRLACATGAAVAPESKLQLPALGSSKLTVITPSVLELELITTEAANAAAPAIWNFVDPAGKARLPGSGKLAVVADGQPIAIKALGFKRRVLYAPFKQRDLRIANYLYAQLGTDLPDEKAVEVRNPDRTLWTERVVFRTTTSRQRLSPVIHVNQTGYLARFSKSAMIGYYLGSLGELNLESIQPLAFRLDDAGTGKEVYSGKLSWRRDRGFPFQTYQQVLEADFSDYKTPGQYVLSVPGLGCSFPFFIGDEVAGAFARANALGIYHQRCGTDNVMPYTRFEHGPCHTRPAEVPDASRKFESANESLKKESSNYKDNPRHSAPQLSNMAASLYPFVNRGPVNVRGGHHDAGDYSKYTINSASFIHHLVLSADIFPGVSALDNLGLPESGDGKSDILQEAKWEADFLARMQDADGGFYFLVYPRDREYENDVTPDKGDPQIVFPKTTSVTAAATAALAQCASSPEFKKEFPESAVEYLEKSKKGWAFLERAIARFGKDGAYQKITHYGDEFMHDDELAWAACELFLATGEKRYQEKLMESLNPSDPNTRRWGWWRLYDAYGCAIRSYAFAARSGRLKRDQLNRLFLEQCENEIAAAGEDQMRRAQDSAYGTSFPEETKRALSAGWYFSSDAAFDLAVACQLEYPSKRDPRPKMIDALLTNLNYEQGCNPVNVVYLTGLGWKRQREIVHQFAQNDRRILPPTGIPLGNIQAGFGWNTTYQQELDKLSFPSDGADQAPYPFYDRWGDAFNLSQEFVIVNQARALGYTAWLMAMTPLKDQKWKAAAARITGWNERSNNPIRLELAAAGVDLSAARIVWEAQNMEPFLGAVWTLPAGKRIPDWIEAEAQLPDGRRIFAVQNIH
ncbi:MAG TPA: glycoside hydrolase family 9 protein [Verrucomicrobiae bacterium]|nr:glycoside hydrolase family 9 protein [Verrucomicrobiae bacterium]